MPRRLGIASIGIVLATLAAGCVTSATEVIVHLDTDAPPNRPLSIDVVVRPQSPPGSPGSRHSWTRGGDGGIVLPASFAVIPAPGEREDDTVTFVLTALFGVANGQPSATITRTVTFAFEPRRTVPLSIFLASSCALLATGCSTPGVPCTVSQRCIEMGMTCGDMGLCVGSTVTLHDGGMDVVATDAPRDGCIPDCTGRMCGPDPRCATSCGTCASGTMCATSGQCVLMVSCGDHTCSSGETCANCPGDCPCGAGQTCDGSGQCVQAIRCGDGTCNGGENCSSCPSDCGCSGGQVCRSGACCTPNCGGVSCGPDGCGGSCGGCGSGLSCVGGSCMAMCGDGACAPGVEDCGVCPADCPCASGQVCFNRSCCMPNCTGRTCGSDGCGGTCGTCALNETCDTTGNCTCNNLQCGTTCCNATACACGCSNPNHCCTPLQCSSLPDCAC